MGIRGSFPGGKAARAWSLLLTSIWFRDQRMCGIIPPLPNTPSWRGDQLKHRYNFTFTLYIYSEKKSHYQHEEVPALCHRIPDGILWRQRAVKKKHPLLKIKFFNSI
jgi:hypothetical protein